jgi:hypothetical protein
MASKICKRFKENLVTLCRIVLDILIVNINLTYRRPVGNSNEDINLCGFAKFIKKG